MKRYLKSIYFVVLLVLLVLVVGAGGTLAQTRAPQLGWHYTFPDGAAYGLGVSETGDVLVAVIGFGFDPGGQIVSLDPATGDVRWSVETGEGASADPIVADGVVYVGMGSLTGGGAAVYALDAATGAERWRTDVENRTLPATPIDTVVFSNGKLFVNRGDAILIKLDAATGDLEWEVDLQKPSRGAPFVADGMVFVTTGFDGGRIVAYDAETGAERWSVEDTDNPVTGPVLADGHLLVSFVDGELAAFDPATGQERWRVRAGVRDEAGDMDPWPGLPLALDGTVYLSSNGFAGAYTVAFDLHTGQELWSTPTGDFSAGAPAIADDTLVLGSDSGDLLGLDPSTGVELWRVAIPEKIDLDLNQATPPLTGNGWIYTRDETGGVAALIAAMS
ncbi:MAG: hypothetical protein E6R14_11545 [Thermomicrobiales bacterium]|nr:MAG: hypothetical protein E6R14_11545 [Thermomicrobiales bacterium]